MDKLRQDTESRFFCTDGGGPAFVFWLRQQGVQGTFRREDGDEIVEFDVPAEWSGSETERFAKRLIRRIGDEALERLSSLRRSSGARHSDDPNPAGQPRDALAPPNTISRRPAEAGPHSPYLDSEQAAAYLGTSVKSLYGLVERRRLRPLRGPRRRYRFTTEILDEYLRGGGEQR
jgi:excisionase family DNA binding protein